MPHNWWSVIYSSYKLNPKLDYSDVTVEKNLSVNWRELVWNTERTRGTERAPGKGTGYHWDQGSSSRMLDQQTPAKDRGVSVWWLSLVPLFCIVRSFWSKKQERRRPLIEDEEKFFQPHYPPKKSHQKIHKRRKRVVHNLYTSFLRQ